MSSPVHRAAPIGTRLPSARARGSFTFPPGTITAAPRARARSRNGKRAENIQGTLRAAGGRHWHRRAGAAAGAAAAAGGGRGAAIGYRTEEEGYGAVRAIDPQTGNKKWDFKMVDYTESGIVTTASDLLFSGGKEGNFLALDARNGSCSGRRISVGPSRAVRSPIRRTAISTWQYAPTTRYTLSACRSSRHRRPPEPREDRQRSPGVS